MTGADFYWWSFRDEIKSIRLECLNIFFWREFYVDWVLVLALEINFIKSIVLKFWFFFSSKKFYLTFIFKFSNLSFEKYCDTIGIRGKEGR